MIEGCVCSSSTKRCPFFFKKVRQMFLKKNKKNPHNYDIFCSFFSPTILSPSFVLYFFRLNLQRRVKCSSHSTSCHTQEKEKKIPVSINTVFVLNTRRNPRAWVRVLFSVSFFFFFFFVSLQQVLSKMSAARAKVMLPASSPPRAGGGLELLTFALESSLHLQHWEQTDVVGGDDGDDEAETGGIKTFRWEKGRGWRGGGVAWNLNCIMAELSRALAPGCPWVGAINLERSLVLYIAPYSRLLLNREELHRLSLLNSPEFINHSAFTCRRTDRMGAPAHTNIQRARRLLSDVPPQYSASTIWCRSWKERITCPEQQQPAGNAASSLKGHFGLLGVPLLVPFQQRKHTTLEVSAANVLWSFDSWHFFFFFYILIPWNEASCRRDLKMKVIIFFFSLEHQ